MKILTIVYNLEKGGTQKAAQIFAEGYAKLDHDSRILTLYGLGSRYEEIKDFLHVWNTLSKQNLQDIIFWSPDILHIHSHGPKHSDIFTLITSLNRSSLKIIETNVFSTVSSWSKYIDVSFQLSNWCHWLYLIRGGNSTASAMVPYPVKTSSFKRKSDESIKLFRNQHGIPENAFVIGRIGQHYDGKWSYTLLEVFNRLSADNSNIYLIVVNPPESILVLINQSPYKEQVIYIPSIYGDENLALAYSSFDAFYLAAEQGESFGMVIAESILCGTPVVALSTPWGDNSQGEVVGNEIGGYVVHTTKGAIQAIKYIMNKKSDIDFIRIGPESIRKRYDYLKVSQDVIDYVLGTKCQKMDIKKIKRNILKEYSNSFEKPNFLSLIFLNIGLKKFILFSSGYLSWETLAKKIFKKILNLLK